MHKQRPKRGSKQKKKENKTEKGIVNERQKKGRAFERKKRQRERWIE